MSHEIEARARDTGYTPAARDFETLFELLAEAERDRAEPIVRALARAGLPAARAANARLRTSPPRARASLVRLIGRVAGETRDQDLTLALLAATDDEDPKTRRNAIVALGKANAPGAEDRLLALWPGASAEHRRSLAEALGKIGGSRSLALLSAVATEDAELDRLARRAVLMLSRTLGRTGAGGIVLDRPLPRPMVCVVRCRGGLSRLLAEELRGLGRTEVRSTSVVNVHYRGDARGLLVARTAIEFGVRIDLEKGPAPIETRVASALSDASSLSVLAAWTEGTPRFRLAFAHAGHRRATVWRIAEAVAKRGRLVNDPTRAFWEVLVDDAAAAPRLLLLPRAFEDPRFAYRKRDVPAASHPTIAAALARVAGVNRDDVVWDPFVGSGLELVERGLLGGYRSLHGCDLEPKAIEAARANLEAAGLSNAFVAEGNALSYRVPGASLVITNPPMGRRVGRNDGVAALLDAFVATAHRALVRGGRVVWLSPFAERTAKTGLAAGFEVTRLEAVDMGGFSAELQVMRKRP
jgi:predicted RNA methylase